jgi:hypothetical protein
MAVIIDRRMHRGIMNIRILLILVFTHLSAGALGFAAGIYALPILIAPPPPSQVDVEAVALDARYTAQFKRDLKDSDALHWGEGKVSVGEKYVTFMGNLAPGPDYKLYFSPQFVETEADFEQFRPSMQLIGDIDTFKNFVIAVPPGVNLTQFNTVIVWCETFGQFITSAKFR